MRHTWIAAIALVVSPLALLPPTAAAQARWGGAADSSSVRFRLGSFQPKADSNYWDEVFRDFTGSSGDFDDLVVGFDYLWRPDPRLGLMLTVDSYEGSVGQAYRDWVDGSGGDIVHTTTLKTSNLGAAFVVNLVPRPAPVTPYIGAGVGLLSWRLEESGRFIDFSTTDYQVFYGRYSDEGTAFVTYALAGVEIGLNSTWAVVVEGRWRWADDTLSGGFADLDYRDLDLSGTELSAGVQWSF